MHLPDNSDMPKFSQAEETADADIIKSNEGAESQAGKKGRNKQQEISKQSKGSSGPEEKDITD